MEGFSSASAAVAYASFADPDSGFRFRYHLGAVVEEVEDCGYTRGMTVSFVRKNSYDNW